MLSSVRTNEIVRSELPEGQYKSFPTARWNLPIGHRGTEIQTNKRSAGLDTLTIALASSESCSSPGGAPDEAIGAEGTHSLPPVIRSAGTPWAPRTPYVGTIDLEIVPGSAPRNDPAALHHPYMG